MAFKLLATAALAMSATAAAAPKMPRQIDGQLSLTTQIALADTVPARYRLLEDDDFRFDFSANPAAALADRRTFPVLTGTGGAMAYASLPACGMSLVHIHPRSTELFVVTEGTAITNMVLEAGTGEEGASRSISLELTKGQMTVFPVGAFHTVFNPTCQLSAGVVSFVSDDPGFAGIIAETFTLRDDVIVNSFGEAIPEEQLEEFKGRLPQEAFILVQECMDACAQNQTATR